MSAAPTGKTFTLDQVSTHKHEKDCWLIIHGKVYDVTKYLEDHPGGDDVLLSAAGTDASDDFDDAGHSNDAKLLLKDYCVGEVSRVSGKSKVYYSFKLSNNIKKILPWILPVTVVGLAAAVYYATKSSKTQMDKPIKMK